MPAELPWEIVCQVREEYARIVITQGKLPRGWIKHKCNLIGVSRVTLWYWINNMVRNTEFSHGQKLTPNKVRTIRKLYFEEGLPQSVIGERFGVSKTLVSQITQGKKWAGVK